jgi:hypothetical protein
MTNPDAINPEALTKKKGFRSRKPDAMTVAERQRKYRLTQGGRAVNVTLAPEVGAGFIYLKREWGMKTDREVVEAAIRFLTICTRQGLTRLPQTLED